MCWYRHNKAGMIKYISITKFALKKEVAFKTFAPYCIYSQNPYTALRYTLSLFPRYIRGHCVSFLFVNCSCTA